MNPAAHVPVGTNAPMVQSIHGRAVVVVHGAPPFVGVIMVDWVAVIEPDSQVDPKTGTGAPSKQSSQLTEVVGVQAAPLLEAVVRVP